MEDYHVYVDEPYNIVTISKTLHKHIHTNSYFTAVEILIRTAAYGKPTSEKQTAIISRILTIGAYLILADNIIKKFIY